MRDTKRYFVLAAALVLLGTSAAVTAHATRRMVPVATTIKEMLDELDATMRRELENGCVEDDPIFGKRLCGESKKKADAAHEKAVRQIDALRARPPEKRGGALGRIRAFRKNVALSLTYQSTSSNPYRDDDADIESYVDDQGFEYWVDPQNDVLVQAGPYAYPHPASRPPAPEARLAVAALRDIALGMIRSQVPDFDAVRSSLHPLEDNKSRSVYFFRWDDFSSPARESEMPPFIQVGLNADGTLASYTDTLRR